MAVGPKKDVGSAPSAGSGDAQLASAYADTLQPERVVTVLAVSPFEDDHLFLRSIFGHSKWQIHSARSWGEAQAFLSRQPMPVVLCESELDDGTWKDVLGGLSAAPDPPALVVTSRLADEYLWAEVLNLGGYDVLMKPFESTEVFRVISLAWLNWKNTRERARAARLSFAGAIAV
jgi:DNA-binding response OmpR family regulator